MTDFGFPSSAKIRSRTQFRETVEHGRRAETDVFTLWWKPSNTVGVRFGVTVSRKLGNAPQRNRVKRLTREVFRLHRHRLLEGTDVILRPKSGGKKIKNFDEAKNAILHIWEKAGIILGR